MHLLVTVFGISGFYVNIYLQISVVNMKICIIVSHIFMVETKL